MLLSGKYCYDMQTYILYTIFIQRKTSSDEVGLINKCDGILGRKKYPRECFLHSRLLRHRMRRLQFVCKSKTTHFRLDHYTRRSESVQCTPQSQALMADRLVDSKSA